MNKIEDFLISKARVKMLELFFTHPEEMYYVREISRKTKEEINAIRRELSRLLNAGMLRSEQRGNRLYYTVNQKYPFFQEILRLIAKSTGLGKKIRTLHRKLGTLDFVMFSGTFVHNIQPKSGELDVLIIGDVVLSELDALIKDEEKQLGREINYAVFSAEEFEFRKQRRDPFVMDVLYATRVMVIGDEVQFAYRKPPTL